MLFEPLVQCMQHRDHLDLRDHAHDMDSCEHIFQSNI